MRSRGIAAGRFAFVLVTLALLLMTGWIAPAQDAETRYLRIAPIEQYLMNREAEISLARSAAPSSVSADAEVLVLAPNGYQTAVKGKNGFVCVVERSWMSPFDDPEFLNPDQRLPLCLNPPAVRTHLPLTLKATALALSGMSKPQMFVAIKTAYQKKELPVPAPGSMCFMLSKQQYFGKKYKNADPHVMFWFPQTDHMNWGAGLPGSPVYVNQNSPDPITTFVISVSQWSDGTAAPTDSN
jgi:hypothetical protein